MELLVFILFVFFLTLVSSSILSNQKKSIQSSKKIEGKLDKIIELLTKEDHLKKIENRK